MAKLVITPENQIQRLNSILNTVENLASLPTNQLVYRPRPKSWSVIEIIEHLSVAYDIYVDKIDSALEKLPEKAGDNTSFTPNWWQRFIINGVKPKGGQRKLKIKTLKKFEPLLQLETLDEATIVPVFERFKKLQLHLKNAILVTRFKEVKAIKINSGIGPIVKFYLPESFEFLIAHMERHMLQIEEVLQQMDS
ncbi:DinB family protein [Maribacter sp. 2307UL18-2]|uniref:DinB family protein n=1 Tax=Maribacter sp. 2307UL18-2 TaxID=3386274 RepID=UPI0039BD6F55